MSDSSTIEWTDATLNIVVGCDRVSPGCDHCYIERTWPVFGKGRKFDERGRMGIELHPERLAWLSDRSEWREGRKIFTPSLGDLFHKDVPNDFIAQAFATFSLHPHHTFQILTKRERRLELLRDPGFLRAVDDHRGAEAGDFEWPLPNVWLGVSVESQRHADLRIPWLMNAVAAVRFLSIEPLLGPIDLTGWFWNSLGARLLCPLDWVIVGGESGPGARPMHPQWARVLRDQCVTADVPFFFKQWGEWAWTGPAVPAQDQVVDDGSGSFCKMWRVGKKHAGRVLDGRSWDEFPKIEVPA